LLGLHFLALRGARLPGAARELSGEKVGAAGADASVQDRGPRPAASVEWTLVVDREVAVEREQQQAIARQEVMVEELRKAELVRDRLESLEQSAKAYPEGHDMRVLIEELHIKQALRAVEEEIRSLREALIHPRGT
jgi:hypothetical protein